MHVVKMAYFSFFIHTYVAYGVRLWGHSPNYSKVLLLKKRATVNLLADAGYLDHCKVLGLLFVRLNMLTVWWTCITYIELCTKLIKENLNRLFIYYLFIHITLVTLWWVMSSTLQTKSSKIIGDVHSHASRSGHNLVYPRC